MQVELERLPVQKEFMEATEDFVAIVSSRSCGKSWIAMLCALDDMMHGRNVIYCAQTDGAFYKGPWKHLQFFLHKFNLLGRWHWNSTYKTGTLNLGNGVKSNMYMGSYTSECDEVRGSTEISAIYLDEFVLSKPSILGALTPCCRGHDNYGNIIDKVKIRAVSTPNMESLWQVMLVENEKYGIRLLRARLADMPEHMVPQAVKDGIAASIFSADLRRQEVDGEIIMAQDATALISLREFPTEVPYFSDDRVYGGLDMAHGGQRDSHCFGAIKGNRLVAFHQFGVCDSLEVARWIRNFNKKYKMTSLNMDLAWSEAVFEQLRYEVPCRQVSFAEKAPTEQEQRQYGNIRASGFFKLCQMHREGLCVDVEPNEFIDEDIVAEYKREITNMHFTIANDGRLLIEKKELIRERLHRSPDPADALMLAGLDRILRIDPRFKANTVASVSAEEEAEIMEDI